MDTRLPQQKVIRESAPLFNHSAFSIQHRRLGGYKSLASIADQGAHRATLCTRKHRAMPWLATLLAALALRCVLAGNRFAAYDELRAPPKRCSGSLDCSEEVVDNNSKMFNALFGTPATTHPSEAALTPYQLPAMYYNDFYEDLLTSKRNDVHAAGCDCKVMNDLIDLGNTHFPRYLMSAVCESRPARDAKCTQGSNCKPLEYKVKVLTLTPEQQSSKTASRLWLNEDAVSQPWQWQFKTVSVTAGCFCTN